MLLDRTPEPEWMDLPEEADAYAAADFDAVNQEAVRTLLDAVGQCPDAALLDFGTGPGDIPRRLAEARPAWRIVAVDAAGAMLDHARRATAAMANVMLVQGDAKALPLGDGQFDILFSNSILHQLHEPVRMWREVGRVGRRGAHVLFRDLTRPDSGSQREALVREYASGESALLQEEFRRSLDAAFRPEEVEAQLREAGLHGVQVRRITDRHLDVFGQL
jgi:ubiquinone/menaquinone biosynthesis C-methylase UbiE